MTWSTNSDTEAAAKIEGEAINSLNLHLDSVHLPQAYDETNGDRTNELSPEHIPHSSPTVTPPNISSSIQESVNSEINAWTMAVQNPDASFHNLYDQLNCQKASRTKRRPRKEAPSRSTDDPFGGRAHHPLRKGGDHASGAGRSNSARSSNHGPQSRQFPRISHNLTHASNDAWDTVGDEEWGNETHAEPHRGTSINDSFAPVNDWENESENARGSRRTAQKPAVDVLGTAVCDDPWDTAGGDETGHNPTASTSFPSPAQSTGPVQKRHQEASVPAAVYDDPWETACASNDFDQPTRPDYNTKPTDRDRSDFYRPSLQARLNETSTSTGQKRTDSRPNRNEFGSALKRNESGPKHNQSVGAAVLDDPWETASNQIGNEHNPSRLRNVDRAGDIGKKRHPVVQERPATTNTGHVYDDPWEHPHVNRAGHDVDANNPIYHTSDLQQGNRYARPPVQPYLRDTDMGRNLQQNMDPFGDPRAQAQSHYPSYPAHYYNVPNMAYGGVRRLSDPYNDPYNDSAYVQRRHLPPTATPSLCEDPPIMKSYGGRSMNTFEHRALGGDPYAPPMRLPNTGVRGRNDMYPVSTNAFDSNTKPINSLGSNRPAYPAQVRNPNTTVRGRHEMDPVDAYDTSINSKTFGQCRYNSNMAGASGGMPDVYPGLPPMRYPVRVRSEMKPNRGAGYGGPTPYPDPTEWNDGPNAPVRGPTPRASTSGSMRSEFAAPSPSRPAFGAYQHGEGGGHAVTGSNDW